jgi:hypothetical protein
MFFLSIRYHPGLFYADSSGQIDPARSKPKVERVWRVPGNDLSDAQRLAAVADFSLKQSRLSHCPEPNTLDQGPYGAFRHALDRTDG